MTDMSRLRSGALADSVSASTTLSRPVRPASVMGLSVLSVSLMSLSIEMYPQKPLEGTETDSEMSGDSETRQILSWSRTTSSCSGDFASEKAFFVRLEEALAPRKRETVTRPERLEATVKSPKLV